jgi:Uncharacterized protein conserved in bacteria (DUF2213)
MIGGALRVKRVLSDPEVHGILTKAGDYEGAKAETHHLADKKTAMDSIPPELKQFVRSRLHRLAMDRKPGWTVPRMARKPGWTVPRFRSPLIVQLAMDKALAMDRSSWKPLRSEREIIAMDRAGPSLRRLSEDGHLHVKQSNISKATVNPYWGAEIPDHVKLGLDPKQKYMLLRHPRELAKAADTFNNLPILAEHTPVSAGKHPSDLVVGSTGTDAVYHHPYLRNSLVFWPQAAIDAIDNGEQRELSAAYHYDPVMTPGIYEGQRYDGIMTNIRGNHVSIVSDGRAGGDVVVADAAFDPFRYFRAEEGL